MQTTTEKKKTVREQMIAVGLQTVVVVVVVVVLLLFVGVVSGSGTLYVFTNFKDDFEGNTRARRQTENSPRAHKLFCLLRAMDDALKIPPTRKRMCSSYYHTG